jgi:Icc-related predicted phosphoesterase
MIRVAAVGDVHYDRNSKGRLGKHLALLAGNADIFLLAGDLTQTGHIEEARPLMEDLRLSPVPVVAVLGNHDYHSNQESQIIRMFEDNGIRMLEGGVATFQFGKCELGIAGLKGFGGGFLGACGSDFGEPEMKAFIRHTQEGATQLKTSLENLKSDYKVALLHYAPVPETLMGETKEIYPFLGSYLLAQAVDEGKADIVFHGHAHKGSEKGLTPAGIPVRNVAQPVIRHAFNIYTLNKEGVVFHTDPGPRFEAVRAGH